jgi:tetratricopeptide (TPR) repeat protein
MKCPKCGTTNGKTNKFCRECGFRLEGLPAQDSQQPAAGVACAPDEVALGEELFEVWQYYSSGSLDTALAKAEKIIGCTPESASAHSILALIHEKKAEQQFASGDAEAAREHLKQAISRYEKIIDLNPNSAADREKLASLRLMLAGGGPVGGVSGADKPRLGSAVGVRYASFVGAIRKVPMPVLAGLGTMVVLFVVGLVILLSSGDDEPARAAKSGRDAPSGRISPVSTPGALQASPAAPSGSAPLKVYTFPPPVQQNSQAGSASVPPTPPPAREKLDLKVEPVKLPPLAGAQLSVVPEPKGGDKPAKKPGTSQARPSGGEPARAQGETAPARPAEPRGSDGDDLLAEAIRLHNQGRNTEAITLAQQAAGVFQADIDAGRDVTTAKRGAENARKLLQAWQSPAASSSE